MGQIKLMGSIIMTTLFAIAIVSFAINFANDNNSLVNLANDSDFINMNNSLMGNLSQLQNDANTSYETLRTTTQEAGDSSASTGGQFKVGFGGIIKMTYSSLRVAYSKIFGDDSGFGVVFSTFISFLLLIGGFYIWKTWKGSPD